MELTDILPTELLFVFGVPLLVAVILVLVAGRKDDDTAQTRTQARYLAAIGLVSLFVTLFALFGTVRGLTDLIVDKEKVESSTSLPKSLEDVLESLPGGSGIDLAGGHDSGDDDADYRLAVQSLLLAIAAGLVFAFHDRRAHRLVHEEEIDASGTGRVARAYLYGIAFVAALVVLVALARAGYGVFRVVAPGVTGSGSEDVERQRGIAELLSYAFLAAGGAFIFFRAWLHLPEHEQHAGETG
jgi:drug/metabolite transporter (DMT)-like permease